MPGFGTTWDRLERAVGRLETALDHLAERRDEDAAKHVDADRRRISSLEEENGILKNMTSQIDRKVETAMRHIEAAMEK